MNLSSSIFVFYFSFLLVEQTFGVVKSILQHLKNDEVLNQLPVESSLSENHHSRNSTTDSKSSNRSNSNTTTIIGNHQSGSTLLHPSSALVSLPEIDLYSFNLLMPHSLPN